MENIPARPQPETGRMARAMQVLLAVEIVAYGTGIWLLTAAGWAFWQALLLMLGVYLGLRALAVADNFRKTWQARTPRSPEHRLGLVGTLRLFWGEYYATVLCYSFLFPFEKWLAPLAPRVTQPGAGIPIILVPGFCCNRGYWPAMARHLSRQGLGPVYAVTLEPLLGSMQDNARHLAHYVEAVRQHSQADKVILVGHSMGGVVARVYLHELGGERFVAKIIQLGTPNEGTVIAEMIAGLGENLQQMTHDSEWSRAFNRNQQQDCPVPITAIITPHDNIVAPQSSCQLHYPNAKSHYLPGVGHLEMPLSSRVMETVAKEIEETTIPSRLADEERSEQREQV